MNEDFTVAKAIYKQYGEWRVLAERLDDPSPLSYALEEAVGEAVAREEVPPTLRIWRGPRALVVAKKDLRTQRAVDAAGMMKQVDWPVYVRQSGGTAVPHGPGTLNLSLFLPRPRRVEWTIDDIYRALGLPLAQMMRKAYRLQPYFGEVPGSFCDGRFNVVVQGKKIVGTSQVWKGGPAGLASKRPGYILAHATLLTTIDREQTVSALNAWYELAEGTKPVYIDTVATLASYVPQGLAEDGHVVSTLLDAIQGMTDRSRVETTVSEKERKSASKYQTNADPESYRRRASG
ncbi:lipoate--protein ligase family protein [Desmospora profundinema]|uniref:Lipoate-protein ligase A n=1 Tax=Desmospora profundinema TaxID=1571184 RepID=A0ABU1IMJ0_9BACL|nr:hypothetical protein [Desmospora profundinema]MDR6226002.1 lipoate-protein ligase A [Desmospora profundinema]